MAVVTRADVWSLATEDPILAYYGQAVQAMRAKPANDPTSWAYQAAIHGTYATPAQPGWNECRHGSWYFLPWHRAYLYCFERIVRAQVVALGGPASWALPFWDYGAGGTRNQLPMAFRAPTLLSGQPNALYVTGRRLTGAAGLPPSVTTSAFAMGRSQFTGAAEFGGGRTSPTNMFFGQTGRLEQTPHNDVHVMIGGWMGDPATAAQDPIFWLHHCNIDRLWWSWQETHASSSDSQWANQAFSFFDADGTVVAKRARELEDVALLGYTYPDVQPSGVLEATDAGVVEWPKPWPKPSLDINMSRKRRAEDPGREIVGATDKTVTLRGQTEQVTVRVDARATESLEGAVPVEERQHRAFLDIENVDAAENPATVYGVYLNLPDTPTPQQLSAHHVGNVSLFGVERIRSPAVDEQPHALRFSLEVTELLNQLAANNEWKDGDKLDVTFRPVQLQTEDGLEGIEDTGHADIPIRIGRISVHYQ